MRTQTGLKTKKIHTYANISISRLRLIVLSIYLFLQKFIFTSNLRYPGCNCVGLNKIYSYIIIIAQQKKYRKHKSNILI